MFLRKIPASCRVREVEFDPPIGDSSVLWLLSIYFLLFSFLRKKGGREDKKRVY
jgi:hypothetical protein